MSEWPELLLHIGAGKTGSTSIQFTLRNAREALEERGVAYVGLMLELIAGARKHDWCVEGAPQKYFRSENRQKTNDEVHRVIHDALKQYGERGIRQVIWSNEAFLPRWDHILEVIERLDRDGVPIRILCYVRRHDKWARSGYVQFGIKHKTYSGPVRSFAEWINAQDIGYAKNLDVWRRAFPDKVEVYNFDAVGDVVSHFLAKAGVEGIKSIRANDSPSNALLAAWATFNGRFDTQMLPNAFTRVAKPLKILNPRGTAVPSIDKLLPTTQELLDVQDRYRDDLDAVNTLLAAQGEPPMVFDAPEEKNRAASSWEIDHMLLHMVFALQKQVSDLQDEVEALKKSEKDDA